MFHWPKVAYGALGGQPSGLLDPAAQGAALGRSIACFSTMPVQITPHLSLPDSDFTWSFVRASGPGGQNVNKVATAAQLRFDLAGTESLEPAVKARLRSLAGRRVTEDGALIIVARNQRTQEGNRREALERLTELVQRALVPPKVRRATRPTRASRERRLDTKTQQRTTKQLRRKVRWDE
jgi:ribosome-associated protein